VSLLHKFFYPFFVHPQYVASPTQAPSFCHNWLFVTALALTSNPLLTVFFWPKSLFFLQVWTCCLFVVWCCFIYEAIKCWSLYPLCVGFPAFLYALKIATTIWHCPIQQLNSEFLNWQKQGH
jgi:hypothetical protein